LQAIVIREWSAFDRLEPEWNELLLRSRASSIFLTWEWISAWRAVINDSVPPCVIVVRDQNGRLVGIASMYVASMRFAKVLRYRVLRFMADAETGSEYPDWIVDADVEDEVLAAIVDTLSTNSGTWDTLWLPRVAGWTGAKNRLLCERARQAFRFRIRTQEFSSVALGPTLDEFESRLSANRRQQVRRNSRNVMQIQDLEFVICSKAEELDEFLEALIELHQRRWIAAGQDGVFRRRPTEEQFYRKFVPMAFKNGWLAMFGLRHHGQLKAVQLGYIFNKVYHQLQEGYDPEFIDGAGNALRHMVISHCIDRGVRAYDFLGGWSEHKRRWGAEKRDGYDVFIAARKLRTLPLFFREVWPSGRFIELAKKR
jgi:CelD/BcsL family acetyltransferase involved in cellulose biosynthesis